MNFFGSLGFRFEAQGLKVQGLGFKVQGCFSESVDFGISSGEGTCSKTEEANTCVSTARNAVPAKHAALQHSPRNTRTKTGFPKFHKSSKPAHLTELLRV